MCTLHTQRNHRAPRHSYANVFRRAAQVSRHAYAYVLCRAAQVYRHAYAYALRRAAQVSDAVILMRNDDAHAVCARMHRLKTVRFRDMNKVIGRCLAGILKPARTFGVCCRPELATVVRCRRVSNPPPLTHSAPDLAIPAPYADTLETTSNTSHSFRLCTALSHPAARVPPPWYPPFSSSAAHPPFTFMTSRSRKIRLAPHCMYVCMCVYVNCVCVRVDEHVMFMCAYVCVCVCVYACVSMCVYAYVCACVYVPMELHSTVSASACVHAFVGPVPWCARTPHILTDAPRRYCGSIE